MGSNSHDRFLITYHEGHKEVTHFSSAERKQVSTQILYPVKTSFRYKEVNQDICHQQIYPKRTAQESSLALAGVAQWIECGPANQRVTGSIPSQGTRLGCGPGPQ